MMNGTISDGLSHFIAHKRINSFQKLRLLLFLYHYPDRVKSCQEISDWLHIKDTLLVDAILSELEDAGLLVRKGNRCYVSGEPDIQQNLQELSTGFDDPLTRQEILARIRPKNYTPAIHRRYNLEID